MELTDAELVRACIDGDQQAWEQLVQRYQRLVYSIPRRSGLDQDAAAEVFQRVFTSLVEHLDGLERPERVSAWLVTAAKRESWRAARRPAASRAALAPEEHAADVPDSEVLAEDELVRLEEHATLRRAIDCLEDRCRELVYLMFYADEPLSYGEVAERLGIAEGSIGPIRGRCLERLRRLMATTHAFVVV